MSCLEILSRYSSIFVSLYICLFLCLLKLYVVVVVVVVVVVATLLVVVLSGFVFGLSLVELHFISECCCAYNNGDERDYFLYFQLGNISILVIFY